MSTLTLTITNLEALEQGVALWHQFNRKGGTIGSLNAHWRMNDRDRRVQPIHCEIRWQEGCFCVIDLCNQTYLNGSRTSLGNDAPTKLIDGDELYIGAYRLRVRHQPNSARDRSLEALLASGQSTLDALIREGASMVLEAPNELPIIDICDVFNSTLGRAPLAALDRSQNVKPEHGNSLQRLLTGERP